MRKFKLVKIYPGSPGLDTIVTEDDYEQFIDDCISIYSNYEVVNYPEFWEEVKNEIDWRNLSLEDWLTETKKLNLSLNALQMHINDGETSNINNHYTKLKGTFAIDKARLLYNEWKNPVLFTTMDGVNVYKGGTYYYVVINEIGFRPWLVNQDVADWKNRACVPLGHVQFSTKEYAEEYILMNKPCLSIEDVMSVAYNPVETKTSSSKKLKQIVISKMKTHVSEKKK